MKSNNYPNILAAWLGTVWLANDQTMQQLEVIANRILDGGTLSGSAMAGVLVQQHGIAIGAQLDDMRVGGGAAGKVRLTDNGIAIVPIMGPIVPHMNAMTDISGGTSASALQSVARRLAQDDRVKHTLLHVDSGGGAVLGLESSRLALKDLAAAKPMTAFVEHSMYSGAYFLASVAHKIVMTPTAGIGSIGAIAVFEERSKELKKKGRSVRIFRSTELKAVPHSLEPITQKGQDIIQEKVDAAARLFIHAVADNRNISIEQAEAMADGKTHGVDSAIKNKIADEKGTVETVMDEISESISVEDLQASNVEKDAEILRLQTEILAAKEDENIRAKKELHASITSVVLSAIDDGRIGTASQDVWQKTGEHVGLEAMSALLESVPKASATPLDSLSVLGETSTPKPAANVLSYADGGPPQTEEEIHLAKQMPSLVKKFDL